MRAKKAKGSEGTVDKANYINALTELSAKLSNIDIDEESISVSNDMIEYLFQYMDLGTLVAFAKTCQTALDVFSHITNLSIDYDFKRHYDNEIRFFVKHVKQINNFTVNWCSDELPWWYLIFDKFQTIQKLSLCNVRITDPEFLNRLANMKNLKCLELKDNQITDLEIPFNDSNLPISTLHELKMSDHRGIFFTHLIKRIVNLSEVHIEIKWSGSLCQLSHLTMLKSLNIEPVYSQDFMTDPIAAFLTRFQQLNRLRIGDLDDNTVENVCQLTNLTHLEIADSGRMGIDGLTSIGKHLINLEMLDITFGLYNTFELTSESVKPLQNLRYLKRLNISSYSENVERIQNKLNKKLLLEHCSIKCLR